MAANKKIKSGTQRVLRDGCQWRLMDHGMVRSLLTALLEKTGATYAPLIHLSFSFFIKYIDFNEKVVFEVTSDTTFH